MKDLFDNKEWRERRNNLYDAIVDNYGEDFFQRKSILELGCGYGHLGVMFYMLGSEVTCLEARPEHIKQGKILHPYMTFIRSDLDSEWLYPFPLNDFDIVLHIGVLYHLERPEINLMRVCKSMKKDSVIILETEFVDTDDPDVMMCFRKQGYNLSFRDYGCRPSHGMIENALQQSNIVFNKMTSAQYDHPMYIYSTPRKNDCHFNRAERGIWFGKKG